MIHTRFSFSVMMHLLWHPIITFNTYLGAEIFEYVKAEAHK